MNPHKGDKLESGKLMELVTAENVEPDVEIESDKEYPAGGQSVAQAVQPNPDTVKILKRLREKDMLVPGSRLSEEIKNEYPKDKTPTAIQRLWKNRIPGRPG